MDCGAPKRELRGAGQLSVGAPSLGLSPPLPAELREPSSGLPVFSQFWNSDLEVTRVVTSSASGCEKGPSAEGLVVQAWEGGCGEWATAAPSHR